MKEPNTFIVGAPKCGTTALSDYLREHPNVFISVPKEPHFFATDFPGRRRKTNTVEKYLCLFESAGDEHVAVGEASVHYLQSFEAVKNIHAFNSKARLIAMLRNPVEMVYSMHSQALASLNEDVADFAQAWDLESQRSRGKHVPEHCRDVQILHYSQVARYAEQLRRVYRYFPPEQVKVIFFEDFKRDTRGTYESVLNFLGVPQDGRSEFPTINSNKAARNPLLARFTQRPPEPLRKLVLRGKKFLGLEDKPLGALETLRKVNFVRAEREPLSPEMRRKVLAAYEDDIRALSNLTGRDLSHWLAGQE